MITYAIVSNSGKTRTDTKKINQVKPTEPDFKEVVFRRSLAKCNFQTGQWVKIRGTSRKAEIKDIYTTLDKVVWQKNMPYYIEVELPDGNRMIAAPHQIHRRKL